MSVNGVTGSVSSDYSNYGGYNKVSKNDNTAATKDVVEVKDVAAEEGVIYESGADTNATASSTAKTYTPDRNMINKLKADAEARTQQLQDIVEKLLMKQGTAYDTALGLKHMYANLEVDAETQAQAKADIAEDGYWGVTQTSERIFDFAMALSGGDPEQMDKMKAAFLKGYEKAEKAWGDSLPDISKRTYDAVIKKFDEYKNQATAPENTDKAQA